MKTTLKALVGAFVVISMFVGVGSTAQAVDSVVATCPVCGGFLQPPCPLCWTEGGKCIGQCIKPGGPAACRAQFCTQGDGSKDGASSGGAQMMQQMAQQLLQQLMSGGGGGGEFTDPNTYAPSTTASVLGNLDFDPNADTAHQAVDEQLQNLLGAGADEESAESAVFGALQSSGTGATPAAAKPKSVISSAVETVQNAYGKLTGGVTSKKTTDAGGSTVAVGGTSGATGVGAFFGGIFGGSSGANSSLLAKLCTSRPWAGGVISAVFSSTLFDSLCEKAGIVVGPAQPTLATGAQKQESVRATLTCPTRIAPSSKATIHWKCVSGGKSTGVGFDTGGLQEGSMQLAIVGSTILGLKCTDGSAATCAIELGQPAADIYASPTVVNLGGRTRLFWTSENVESCVVEGIGMHEKSTTGASMTPAIYDTTEFTITCDVGDGSTITKSVKVGI